MNLRALVAAAGLAILISGCQSAPWKTAANSRFGLGKLRSRQTKARAEDVELVSGENLRKSKRNRGDGPKSQPGDSKARVALQRGHKAEADGQLEQAKEHYRDVLEAAPRNALAHHRLAILADKQREFDKAKEHYLDALSINRNDPNLLSDLGYSFLLQNRPDESKYYLEKALKHDPDHARAMNNLGLLNARQGDYDGALAMFRRTSSEREVQEKLQELFPNGRPRGGESIAAGDLPFAAGELPLAANERSPQLPEVTPASGSSDWGDRPLQDRGSAAGGSQAAAATRNEFASNSRGISTAGMNGPPPAQGRLASSFPAAQDQPIGHRHDSHQMPASPLDSLEEWPPRHGPQPAPAQGGAVPFPADFGQPAGNAPGSMNRQPTDRFPANRGPVRTASNSAANSGPFTNSANNPAQGHRQSAGTRMDPRQQAAMIGLNAGPGGVFPMTYDPRTAAQSRQPADPPAIQPRDVAPQFNTEPPSQPGLPHGQFEAAARPSSNFGGERRRTAARPVSQPYPNVYPAGQGQKAMVVRDYRPGAHPADAQQYRPAQQPQNRQQPPYQRYSPAAAQPPGGPLQHSVSRNQQQQQYRPVQSALPRQAAPQYGTQPAAAQRYQSQDYRYAPQPQSANPNEAFQPGNTYRQGAIGR